LMSQNRAYYEKLKSNKKASVVFSKKLLKDLKTSNEDYLDKLIITKEQINKQREILSIVNKEMILIDDEISINTNRISNLEKEREIIKKEYAKLIQFSYQNLNLQKKMIFVLSATSFNKAYKRMVYIKSLSDFRKSRLMKIESIIKEKDSLINALKENKRSKLSLHSEKKGLIDSLEIIRRQLNQFLDKNRSEIVKTQSIVEKENIKRDATKKSVTQQIEKVESNKINPVSNKITKLDSDINSKFEGKKNLLIWPLAKFVVIHRFGDYPHPVLEHVMVKNDGIELGTSAGSSVHSIFEGTVVNIIQIPGDGTSIILKHGNYYSVYSKLNQCLVSQGDNVTKGQVIGKLSKNGSVVKMNFQLWKGKEKLNPEFWLKRQ